MSQFCHRICEGLEVEVFSVPQGVTAIEECLQGVVSLRLREKLEEYLRRHVAKRLAVLCHQRLYFSNVAPPFIFGHVSLKQRSFSSGQIFSGWQIAMCCAISIFVIPKLAVRYKLKQYAEPTLEVLLHFMFAKSSSV